MEIAVIYGGTSSERDVSLSTGKGVIEALRRKGYTVTGIDFNPEELSPIINLKADLAFIGLHGKYGEDGSIQGLLDILNIPYVGSGVMASALAMDKSRAKILFDAAGIPTAKGTVACSGHSLTASPYGYPVVVKPNREGSTIGLTIAEDDTTFQKGLEAALEFDDHVLIESFVSGRELTVSVIDHGNDVEALPVIEIVPKNKYYDYEAKYEPGMSEHIVPARLDDDITKKLKEWSVKAHKELGCKIYSRVDFILPNDGSDPIILEVNTLPGMTPTSLYPDAARAVGLSYDDMVDRLVKLTLNNAVAKL
ncbi:D-alanine--D-alanine ligase [Scopulibacillus darangshiensis]|uniref:D-alanine--D-alanine ligase n=1 Tax=Scopulibacillus darangshiensis TaxID=442528 RepID=A0A4R2P9G0_9BACL|nr:D-alanine--D-alanine ligase [Scopulibacillus darangshiensis]TCP31669.1 D-alanine--D-alanine ligase [Scopulibacillus darangshiensis]